jgi:hypothetical protein
VTFHVGRVAIARWRTLRHMALVIIALAAAHEAIYWSEGQASLVPQDGDHAYWPLLLLVVAASAATLTAWSIWRLGRIAVSRTCERPLPTSFVAEWRSILMRLLPVVSVTYLVLENVEHLLGHGHLEGIDVFLTPGHLLSFPILVAVIALVSAAGALFRWQEAVIAREARGPRAVQKPRRPMSIRLVWFHLAESARNARLLFSEDLGRAPPTASI